MKKYKYLIIGSGMTADAAVRGIREMDADGTIGMIGAEADKPYARPPLSKGLWKGRPLEKIWRGTENFKVDLHLGKKAVELDLAAKLVRDEWGEEYVYEKLLLATGGTPTRLPLGGDDVIYYRTLVDYQRLRALTEKAHRFLVIGAGFIGSELAAALNMNHKQVTMVFLENSIGERVYPPDLSQFLSDVYRQKGVELLANDGIANIEKSGDAFKIQTRSGRTFEVDGVIAGLGVRPNVELASAAGLLTENGIIVDDRLRASAADVYAAGDVARFPHSALGKLARIEHEDNALNMGKQAGRNMAGADEPYTHVPFFYSDLFEYGYEAVGELSSKMDVVADWQEPFKKGVLYYLSDGHVRGVLLWNVWGKVEEASALIAANGSFAAENLKGKIAFE
ncbi:MAG: pyridine nucleotide-disulfide oxidoreductase [Anaerolineae bacterium UTCFX1]|jgi:NADPH-dependent 2,4-dienoyl-CoA reductase/sulfur reductase-like enzyme|nr:MAG: pyridine nucleotide-disulfide oxidoreductase [Anaerolineae bacterium UTCFX1]